MVKSVSDAINSLAYPYYYKSNFHNNNVADNFLSAYSSQYDVKQNNISLSVKALFPLAAKLDAERLNDVDKGFNDIFYLKAPKNLTTRLVYALMMVSPFQREPNYRAATPYLENFSPAASPLPRQDYTLSALSRRHKVKRETQPDPRLFRTDRDYLLAVFLNQHAAAGINLDVIDDRQLAAKLLEFVDKQSSLLPDVARLILSNNNLYGERLGETLSPLQQRGLVGQALCRLIYREESIPLRIAKLFAANRRVTQKEFAVVVQSWPYAEGLDAGKRLWRENYEAAEIPALYLNSLYTVQDGPEWRKKNYSVFLDLDNLWVGSLTWALMQFGARSIALEDMGNLNATSPFSMVELGLGLVSLFRQGLLASGVEPVFYLGLLLYYLRARPEVDLDQLLASGTLDPAFDLLKAELETRHLTAQGLYDSFIFYQVNYQRPTWRLRQAAAEILLEQHCGNATATLVRNNPAAVQHFRHHESSSVRQLMIRPSGQKCRDNGAPIPDLDAFYRQEVDRFSNKIRALDNALLAAAFMPSDINDTNIQSEDVQFMQRAVIQWVIPKLSLKRHHADMIYSNVPVHFLGKTDTFFFQAQCDRQRRLFALQSTDQGYLLRKIVHDEHYLNELKPFMLDWPTAGMMAQYKFSLSSLNHDKHIKQPNETLACFLERYAQIHYQSYRLKIHDQGYQAIEAPFPLIMDAMSGLFIPFYSCINSLVTGRHQAAFAECLTDGALVGMPLIFTGVKAGLGLFREASIGVGQTLSVPRFSASGREIFRNRVPASVQIAGGVAATGSQIGQFMDVMGKEMLKSVDPGFATLRSLSLLTKGLYLALLGRTAVGLISWQSRLAKVSGTIPKFVSISHALDLQLAYGDQADTPLTVSVKGISYPVLRIRNSSMVAVETGERMPDGQLMFAQLDLQSRFGIYKKYYCLYIGNDPCQLTAYSHPDFKIEKNATLPRAQDGHFIWPLSANLPINLVVVHPLYQVEYADRQWVLFEINNRRWAFSRDNGTLMPVDNSDDWQTSPHSINNFVSMIERGEDDRSFNLRLMRLQRRRKRNTALHRIRTWRQFLTRYQLEDNGFFGFAANIYDNSSLSVNIGEAKFRLVPEKNAATFLLCHPTQATAPAFRVAYLVDEGEFVFVSPVGRSNSHHIGELLREKMASDARTRSIAPTDILLPPLFNGAFGYGKQMFLKTGDWYLLITPAGEFYHTQPYGEGEAQSEGWTLRYELFTGSFDLVTPHQSFPLPGTGINESLSRFEKLAARTYPNTTYPTLAALCQPSNQTSGISPESHLGSRLRQVALLLRLDPHRRSELLHASSVALRAFKIDSRLASEWAVDFPPLALWTTLETVVATCRLTDSGEGRLASRQLAQIEGPAWHFPAPILLAAGPEQTLFIVNQGPSPAGATVIKTFAIQLLADGMACKELVSEDGCQRWLPAFEDPQRTMVTKYSLSETQQPIFFVDKAGQIWAQTPDGGRRRLYRNDSHRIVDDIIVSPDGGTVVLLDLSLPAMQRALFYLIPPMGSQALAVDISSSREILISGSLVHNYAWWVTNQGELFVPWEKQWSYMDQEHARWATPEGYQPDFVSPDQRFLGYIKFDGDMHQHELMLIDTITDKRLRLRRTQPFNLEIFRIGKVVSIAFSALNALIAVGFSDGYIELYRIDDEVNSAQGISLGGVNLPQGRFIIANTVYPKLKQMVMKFNNAFDRLLVFHDIGDFSTDLQGNGTYAMAEIYLAV